jgi:hypothetical protein
VLGELAALVPLAAHHRDVVPLLVVLEHCTHTCDMMRVSSNGDACG